MKVKVRLFGYVAERERKRELTVDVDEPATVERVLAAAGVSLGRSVRAAVNAEYATPRTSVRAGDVVSVIPPVGGG
jgi:molybdopterin converting factor small subunit